ncbi:hypothetical protein [Xanthomonas phage Carpasina]|uniref:Uncharacterized protein n=1 Tax=Xanthomonas phage Carpasina TaxID=2163636 RepID=A0A2S1GSU5_9CAUD|nr:hypothetical protein HOT16_gp75 [Xanthomonas phage Carpasina]AWD92470.1 hypothetical protein [Xanthomonas phage Carpasina]
MDQVAASGLIVAAASPSVKLYQKMRRGELRTPLKAQSNRRQFAGIKAESPKPQQAPALKPGLVSGE